MDEDKLEEILFEFGKVVQELAFLAETDPENPETEKRADEIKVLLTELLAKLEPAKCYFIVKLEFTDDTKERIRERDLADFFWNKNRFRAKLVIRIRRHDVRPNQVVCDYPKLTLNPEDLGDEGHKQADKDNISVEDIRQINQENLEGLFAELGFAEDDPSEEEFDPKLHVILQALDDYWTELVEEARRKEFLIRMSDKALWAEKIQEDLTAKTITNTEKFVLGFLADRGLKNMESLADDDTLPCECQAESHKKVFSEIKQRISESKV